MSLHLIQRNYEIKRLYHAGESIAALARKYGMKPDAVKMVVLS